MLPLSEKYMEGGETTIFIGIGFVLNRFLVLNLFNPNWTILKFAPKK